jgi:hypothetical protein
MEAELFEKIIRYATVQITPPAHANISVGFANLKFSI